MIATLAAPPTLLGPGIYPGISSEEYHALPYCSNSRLSLLKRSPAHLLADLSSPRPATDAMRLGTAIHSAVLEPDDFAVRFTVAERCVATTQKQAQCSKGGSVRVGGFWFCSQHAEGAPDAVDVLSATDLATCEGVAASLRRHPRIGRLLECEGQNELTVVWDDAATGVRCKARIDRLVDGFGGVLVDLKTTTDARLDAFERKAFEMGYVRQGAFYADALAAHSVATSHMVIAAVEKDAPSAAAAGREELRILLARYAECVNTDNWPAYDTEIRELSLPAWAWNRLETAA